MNAPALSLLGPGVARKRADRATRDLGVLATRDRLYASTCRGIVLYCMPGGIAAPDRMTQALVDYLSRKHAILRATQFRLRYGRDFATGARRHVRQRDAWWNEGYQDEVDGSVLYRRPDAWSLSRWSCYCRGVETAREEGCK